MAVAKVLPSGEVLLPPEARDALRLEEGDSLLVEVVEGGVMLKPATAAEREAAWRRVLDAPRSVRYVGPEPEPDEDELREIIVDAIHEMHREDEEESGPR